MIPYGRQSISDSDVESVVAVLRSEWLTQGPAVPRFEAAVATYTGAQYAIAMNSATSALHVACLALGLGPGDMVWTTPNTFVASANCAYYCGAEVDFVDIDPQTYNMSVAVLEAKLKGAAKEGRRLPKVVIPVHFAGEPCDMPAIWRLARQYRFHVIEDASHAIGARHAGVAIGACEHSDITIFSFHPVKIVTTGEGGMAVTNDASLADRMRRLRTHGITREADEMSIPSPGDWYYEQIELGYNYRMTDMQAALGASQLARVEAFVAERHRLAARYDEIAASLPVIRPYRNPQSYSALHLYVIQVEERDRIFKEMRANGVGVNVHYIPVNRQPWHHSRSHTTATPNADAYYRHALSLPLYHGLEEDTQDTVCRILRSALRS